MTKNVVLILVLIFLVTPLSVLVTKFAINYSFNIKMSFLQSLVFNTYISLWLVSVKKGNN